MSALGHLSVLQVALWDDQHGAIPHACKCARPLKWDAAAHAAHSQAWALASQSSRVSSGMGSTAWCRIAKLAECRVRATGADGRRGPILLRWQSRLKSASMCVRRVTISWNVGLQLHTFG